MANTKERGISRDRLEAAAAGRIKELNFWLKKLAGFPGKVGFLPDYSRGQTPEATVDKFAHTLPAPLVSTVEKIARGADHTVNAILAAGIMLLLHKYTGATDITIGMPIYKQERPENFINVMVILRNSVQADMTFKQLLVTTAQTIREAIEHYRYPVEVLPEKLNIPVSGDDFPFCDVVLLLENIHDRNHLSHLSVPLVFSYTRRAGAIGGEIAYRGDLYAGASIEGIASRFQHLLGSALGGIDNKVGDLELISHREKQQILVEFNCPASGVSPASTGPCPPALLLRGAEETPHRTAVTWGEHQLTYHRLSTAAAGTAAFLRERGAGPGDIIGVKMERSLDIVIAILGILMAGAAYMPISPGNPKARTGYMLKDSGAALVLTHNESISPEPTDAAWVTMEEIRTGGTAPHTPLPPVSPARDLSHELIYIIYTSGSTGRPKGVMVEHGALVNTVTALARAYPCGEGDGYLFKTNFTFDVSSAELFGWLPGGGSLVVLEAELEKDPTGILMALSRYRITHLNFVPSMFHVFLDILTLRNKKELSRLRYLFLAGEALLPEMVKKFETLETGIRLENLYGPTEAAVYAGMYSLSSWRGRRNIPIGKPLEGVRLYILGKAGHLLPVGIPGELCIAGAGLARGYLNRPELTAEKFACSLPTLPSPLYKTGDWARWLPDGNIEFLGRIDHQVKLRGYRIELGEIEDLLLQLEEIAGAVAHVISSGSGTGVLGAYITGRPPGLDISRLRAHLEEHLPGYMVPSFFMELPELPLTPSGKTDRKRLPLPQVDRERPYQAPRDEVESFLTGTWADILGLETSAIGIDDPFLQLGGHSLKAALIVSRLHKSYQVEVPLGDIFKYPTIRQLADYVKKCEKKAHTPLVVVEEREHYPLSSSQRRLFLLHRYDPDSINYNMPQLLELRGEVDVRKLRDVFSQLLSRHDILRTSFELEGEDPVQRILPAVDFTVEPDRITGSGSISPAIIEERAGAFIRPFDLARPPLLRASLLEVEARRYVLMVDMHHIVSDGVSTALFVTEFASLYRGETPPPLTLQYKDFASWQNRELGGDRLKEQERFWLNVFKTAPTPLTLPYDGARPPLLEFAGNHAGFELDAPAGEELNRCAGEVGLTGYMLLLGLFNIFLARLSGVEDICIGTPAAGRGHEDLQDIIGVFVNTLPMRTSPKEETSTRQYLEDVKTHTLECLKNQDYPYEQLVEKVTSKPDPGRNPLFDAMLVLENFDIPTFQLPGLDISPYPFQHTTSKVDLSLYAWEDDDRRCFSFEYRRKLFIPQTIQRFIAYFRHLAAQFPVKLNRPLAELELLPPEEKQLILENFNNNSAEYPRGLTLDGWFEGQVEKTPDRIAAVFQGQHLTYRGLTSRSGRLARTLCEKGMAGKKVVGVMVERSLEMIVALMSILKAGGAYLPISPRYPRERVKYLCADSGMEFLLSAPQWSGAAEGSSVRVLDLFDPALYIRAEGDERPAPTPRDVAYVIYTSGSTGKPKGVAIEHESAVNRLNWMQRFYPIGEGDVILQKTPYVFDVSVWELFWWSSCGASLYFLAPGEEMNPTAIVRAIVSYRVTTMHFVPSMLSMFLQHLESTETMAEGAKLASLRQVFASGEALGLSQVERFNRLITGIHGTRLINLYGPTEATVDVSYFNCLPALPGTGPMQLIPIGKPIDNTGLYILDKKMRLQPIGVPGELCISGTGLGRGYLNRPELTAEKFVSLDTESRRAESRNKGGRQEALPTGPEAPLPSRLYKTGDLTRWLPDGNIEFLGRIDHQVKIRGFRIELGEIETLLLKQKPIKEAAVIIKEKNGDPYLCAYIVPVSNGPEPDISAIREHLARHVPDYMVPTFFIPLEQLPLTHNGKLDRGALPAPGIVEEPNYAPPRDGLETKLVDMWAELLGLDHQVIGIDSNFIELGGHSLKATLLAARILKAFNTSIRISDILTAPTVRLLAQRLRNTKTHLFAPVEPAETRDYYPLSSAQKRLYLLHRMDENATHYNIRHIVQLHGNIDKERVEKVFNLLIRRHDSLRTSFRMAGGQPVQVIHPHRPFKLHCFNMNTEVRAGEAVHRLIQRFTAPFKLDHPPLLRAGLVEMEDGGALLIVDMHHIIADGLSLDILEKDFMALYSGETPEPPVFQYKDYALWLQSKEVQAAAARQEAFWLSRFQQGPPALELPYDFPRPAIRQYQGDTVRTPLTAGETGGLESIMRSRGVTPFMTWLALVNIFLAKLSGGEDIVVGTPIAGRRHADLEHIIGIFINTLPLRNAHTGDQTFTHFLRRLKEDTLAAFENQDYPFETLVESLGLTRNLSRNALFDVMLLVPTVPPRGQDAPKAGALKAVPFQLEEQTTKFDLTVRVLEKPGEGEILFQYNTSLFKKETVRRFPRYFKTLLRSLAGNPGGQLRHMALISPGERRQILEETNGTAAGPLPHESIIRWFEAQALRTPGHTAAVAPRAGHGETAESITYEKLDRDAGQLALVLMEKGVRPGHIAGLMVEPGLEMITGILAILKTGAAFLSIAPGTPVERIRYILADSAASLLLTQRSTTPCHSLSTTPTLEIDDKKLFQPGHPGPEHLPQPGETLYVLYTSGTTGAPKGVPVKNENLVNYVHWFSSTAGLSSADRSALTSSFAFDLGYTSIFPPLLNGGEVHLLEKEVYVSPRKLIPYLHQYKITYLKMTPSLFGLLAGSEEFSTGYLQSLRLVVLGGEAIIPGDVERAHRAVPHIRFMNHYGPTEATIGCIARFIDFESFELYKKQPTIGTPIFNTRVCIADKWGNLLPPGIPGELCLSGNGLAAGYLNRPQLTAEKFVRLDTGEQAAEAGKYSGAVDEAPAAARFYKTGDLAKLLPGGQIVFLGRMDHQVKIRGYRVEPEEIAHRLRRHRDVTDAVVLTVKNPGGDHALCAYIVSGVAGQPAGGGVKAIEEHLSRSLPGYMIPSYILFIDALPLTPNGKLDRRALPAPTPGQDTSTPSHPLDETGMNMARIWAEVLSIPAATITPDTHFFTAGGHSLSAAVLISALHKEFNVDIPLVKIFETPTLGELSRYLESAASRPCLSIPRAAPAEVYPLSSAQERLFFFTRMEADSIAYNVHRAVLLKGDADKARLEESFRQLIRRHESLRTSFEVRGGEPFQRIHDHAPWSLEILEDQAAPNAGQGSVSRLVDGFIRPFRLSEAPLMRAGLITSTPREHILIVDMHHIISDGISSGILEREFLALYDGQHLPQPRLQYKDYACWQNQWMQGEHREKQENFWLEYLKDSNTAPVFPTDYPRPAVPDTRGKLIRREADRELDRRVKEAVSASGVTLYMYLLAVYTILLSRYSGREDIAAGSAVMGRRHPDLNNVIGMFVNTLVMRNHCPGHLSFREFLGTLKQNTLRALENQDYPFDRLPALLNLEREPGRNPLFDVAFQGDNYLAAPAAVDGEAPAGSLSAGAYRLDDWWESPFDLTLIAGDGSGRLDFSAVYAPALFEPATIEDMLEHYVDILRQVLDNPEMLIRDITVSSRLVPVEQMELPGDEEDFGF